MEPQKRDAQRAEFREESGRALVRGLAGLAAKIEIIKNGKNAMTPFSGMLNEEQIKAVAEYTETLKK